jgi:predicted TIM-barrel fold metal-dependent hydrolase
MVIDCHMHYEPEIFPLERMLASMESHGIEQTALISTMVEPFSLESKSKALAGDLMRSTLMHANPLGQVLYQSTLSKKGYFILLGSKYRIYDEPDNRSVAEVIDKHPDRFVGWIFVNPSAGDPMSEIEEWSSHPGMVGVKAHPFWHRYSVELLDPVAEWCRDHGYPLLIHLGARGGSGDYRRLPEKYQGLKVLYAHAGIPHYRALWAYIKDRKDIYVDLSSPYLNEKLVRTAVDFLGAGKCLYGTDGPYGGQAAGEDFDYGLIKGWIGALPLSEKELQKITSGNFESIRKS